MPISGLAITTTRDESIATVRAALAGDDRVQVGAINGRRIAVAIETDSQQKNNALRQWIQQIPDVEHIDIVFVHLDDEPPANAVCSDDPSCI